MTFKGLDFTIREHISKGKPYIFVVTFFFVVLAALPCLRGFRTPGRRRPLPIGCPWAGDHPLPRPSCPPLRPSPWAPPSLQQRPLAWISPKQDCSCREEFPMWRSTTRQRWEEFSNLSTMHTGVSIIFTYRQYQSPWAQIGFAVGENCSFWLSS